jgi:hypothetical protein
MTVYKTSVQKSLMNGTSSLAALGIHIDSDTAATRWRGELMVLSAQPRRPESTPADTI